VSKYKLTVHQGLSNGRPNHFRRHVGCRGLEEFLVDVHGHVCAELDHGMNFHYSAAERTLTHIQIVFGFPETKYHRHHAPAEHSLKAGSSSPSSKEQIPTKGAYGATTVEMSDLDRTTTATSTYNNLTHAPTAARDPYLGRGTPSRAQWGAYQLSEKPLTDLALSFWIPWKMLAFPIVEFASFVTSWSCSSFLTLNLTQSQVSFRLCHHNAVHVFENTQLK